MPQSTLPRRWLPEIGSLFSGKPARIVRPSRYAVTGRAATAKSAVSQDAESTLEHDMLLLLEFDRRVETYASQPITLCWQDGTGKRHYTPDVAVRYTATAVRADPSLRVALIEVKPRTVLWEDWGDLKPKFKAAIAWCRDRSMSFRILTDIEIRTPYLDNARFLLRFRDGKSPAETCWDDPRPQHIREALAEMQSSTPCALVQALTSDEQRQAEYLPWVWRLVDLGYIGCDLHERLTMASPIWTNGVPMIPQTTNRP